MANTIRDYSATAASNTTVDGADISEGCSPAGINNAIRGVMADLKDVSTGAVSLESPAADSLSLSGALTTTSTIDGRDVAADGTKLDGIEANANVTDAGNVNPLVDAHLNQSTATSGEVLSWNGTDYDWIAAGGGGDLLAANNLSDLANAATARTNLGLGTAATTASTDYATAAQGTTADAALPRTGGAMTGAITTNSTFDGRNVSVDGTKLDGIASGANNYVHPNHTGEVTSTGDGATVIADDVVDEANLKVSNAPTNGYFLSAQSGAAGGLTWAAVAAGGDPDLYRDNAVGATTPAPTGDNAVSIGSGSTTNGNQAFAIGTTAAASATAAVAIGYQAQAVAGATFSAAIGYNARTRAQNATAFTNSNASGVNSIAGAIAFNTSSYGARHTHGVSFGYASKTGGNHAISLGYATNAGANYATCIGRSGSATAENASSLGGKSGLATGISSTTVGGESNKAYADYAVAMGYWTLANKIGQNAFASGRFNDDGDAQTSKFVLRSDTTDATPEALTTNNSAASTNNQIILGNNSAFSFHGTIVARESAASGTDCAAWKVEGLIRREGSAGTTVLVNSATTVLDNTPNWEMALSADTTNGGLAITVTGAAATNIRWVGTIHTSEVTYA